MNEKKIVFIKSKIKKMQKTVNGLNKLIEQSTTIDHREKENLENMKKTTIEAINDSKKQLDEMKVNNY